MNMISTGAFLPEMDASNKQETAAEKFARVWEKKNSKAARAGGVSLMALSLAACGSSSDDTAATNTGTDTGTDTDTGSDTGTETTPVEGVAFALAAGGNVISPNSATAATRSTANDDTFRAASDGGFTSADIIDGGDGTDTLTAIVAEGGTDESIRPLLSNVENVKVTMTAEALGADSPQTFNFTDSSGIRSFELVNIDDADVTVSGITTSTVVTLSGTGVAADSINTITLSGLSTATDGGSDAYTVNLNYTDVDDISLAGVETVTLNLSGKAVDVGDLSAAALETLVITGGVNDADSTTEAAVIGSATAVQFDGLDTGETAVINASGSSNLVTVNTTDDNDLTVTGGAGKLTVNNVDNGSGGVDNAAITVSVTAGAGGVDATIQGGDNGAADTAINTVTVTGSAEGDDVNIDAVVNPTDIAATTADESTSVNATVSTGAGDDTITLTAAVVNITAGAGDDEIVIKDATELTADDSIDAGGDTDTLTFVSAQAANFDGLAAAVLAKVVGYEKIKVSDDYDTAFDATATLANYVVLADDVSVADVDLTVADNATVEFTDAAGGATDELDLIVKNAAAAGQTDNTVNLMFNVDDLVSGDVTFEIEIDDVETINISAVTTDEDTTTAKYIYDGSKNGAADAVNISGTEDIQYTASTANANIVSTGTGDITIVGSATATVITTGDGDDTITGGDAADVISVGAGDDSVTGGLGADEITLGAGRDVVVVAADDDNNDNTNSAFTDSGTAAYDKIADFGLASQSWTGSAANDTVSEMVTRGDAGANADILDLNIANTGGAAPTLAVAGASGTAGTTATSDVEVSATGLVTFAAADDTLAKKLVAIAADTTDIATGETAIFIDSGNTYVFTNVAGNADTLVELTGIEAVGVSLVANTGTLGGDGYVIIA